MLYQFELITRQMYEEGEGQWAIRNNAFCHLLPLALRLSPVLHLPLCFFKSVLRSNFQASDLSPLLKRWRSCSRYRFALSSDLSSSLCQSKISFGNLPSNSMANRLRAGFHSRIGIVHFFDRLPMARYTTFNTASSFGKTR